MGGLGFLISAVISLSIACIYLFLKKEEDYSISLLISLLYGVSNSLIGIIDDRAKIRKKENAGLSPSQKLFLQTICATAFLLARNIFLHPSTVLYFSFGTLDIGMIYYPLTLIMLVGTVNCANLTDGIDGIASGVSLAIGVSLAYLCANTSYDVGSIAFVLIGVCVAFLAYNLHPAKIFMGDTGSLFLGSLAAAACISLGNPLIILFVGIVYVIEGLSVIIQVAGFKITGKRVFKMAPLHHHFEKCGWSENKIVIWAIIITLIFSVLSELLFV
jgi:phospho-N-acetylmuramoyl-pentapeptide-transferase